jgi:uncharacterized protein (TIGR00369 family)
MNGLAFVQERIGTPSMPMGGLFGFELVAAERGMVHARAMPSRNHYNPLNVAHGGFAGTVLDIAMGLVSISVLDDDATGVGTIDLSIRYVRPITESTGLMTVEAKIVHGGRTIVIAEAALSDSRGRLYACGQSTSLIARPQRLGQEGSSTQSALADSPNG